MNDKDLARFGGPIDRIDACPFKSDSLIQQLEYRDPPYWHHLLVGRHIGIHRPDGRHCNWTARLLTKDRRYVQKCLGPALRIGAKFENSFSDPFRIARLSQPSSSKRTLKQLNWLCLRIKHLVRHLWLRIIRARPKKLLEWRGQRSRNRACGI